MKRPLIGTLNVATSLRRNFPKNFIKQLKTSSRLHRDGPSIYSARARFTFDTFHLLSSIETFPQQFK